MQEGQGQRALSVWWVGLVSRALRGRPVPRAHRESRGLKVFQALWGLRGQVESRASREWTGHRERQDPPAAEDLKVWLCA